MRPTAPLRRRPVTPAVTLAAALAAALLALTACSSGDDDGGGRSSDAPGAPADQDAGVAEQEAAADSMSLGDTDLSETRGGPPAEQDTVQRAVISTGHVSLTSDDVEKTAFDVQRIADEYGGEVTDRKTSTDDEGEVRLARLVLRVPAADFSDAFADLEGTADLASSSATSEDVTTEVIDNRVRIRAQRRSLQRVEVLLDRAQSIRDIVAIEAQLTRRQADLDSLEQRQAYLRDQTSMSTITVNVELAEDEPEEKDTDDSGDSGFLAGLSAGWDALVAFGTGLATVTGAALPFAVLLALLGVPVLLLLRSRRRKPTPTTT